MQYLMRLLAHCGCAVTPQIAVPVVQRQMQLPHDDHPAYLASAGAQSLVLEIRMDHPELLGEVVSANQSQHQRPEG